MAIVKKRTIPLPVLKPQPALASPPGIELPKRPPEIVIQQSRQVQRLLKRPLSFDYLIGLTTQTGLIQHATHGIPDLKNGYAVDDNARALVAAVDHFHRFQDRESLRLARIYLSFVDYMQDADGRFFTYLAFNHTNPNQEKSEDAYGRAVWGTGYTVYRCRDDDMRRRAAEIFHRTFQVLPEHLYAPRGWAYSIAGLFYFYKAKKETDTLHRLQLLADKLISTFHQCADPAAGWYWFEDKVTYSNAILPLALIMAWRVTGNSEYKHVAELAFRFLLIHTQKEGMATPIGEKGWWVKGGKKADYDQQPIEAGYTVLALTYFYRYTGREEYLEYANAWLLWYYGENSLGEKVYEEKTGLCRDGLTETAVNRNGGAESTVTYLIAHQELQSLLEKISK